MKSEDKLLYIGLGAAGLYFLARPTYEDILAKILGALGLGGEEPPATAQFNINIVDPSALEKWSPALAHTIDVEIHNPHSIEYDPYLGLSIIGANEQAVKDFPAKRINLKAGETKRVAFLLYPLAGIPRGTLSIVSKAWNKPPGLESASLGIDAVTFTYDYY